MPTKTHTSNTNHSLCSKYSRQHKPKEPQNKMPIDKACKCGKLRIIKAKA